MLGLKNISKKLEIPPVLTPPLVDRNFGMPPAKIPPRPGAAPFGAGGAEGGATALPALLALARVFGAGGLNPPPGTGGAPTGVALPLETLPIH